MDLNPCTLTHFTVGNFHCTFVVWSMVHFLCLSHSIYYARNLWWFPYVFFIYIRIKWMAYLLELNCEHNSIGFDLLRMNSTKVWTDANAYCYAIMYRFNSQCFFNWKKLDLNIVSFSLIRSIFLSKYIVSRCRNEK